MERWFVNVALLSRKELNSLWKDVVLMALILYSFTGGVYAVATGIKTEVSNGTVALIDEDRSELSRRLAGALLPPYFKPAVPVASDQAGPLMDAGDYIFIIRIPPFFERDLLAGRRPALQLEIDATAMTQAGLGAGYVNEIFLSETLGFLWQKGVEAAAPLTVESRLFYNPNGDSAWFTGMMQIITNITVLSIVLVGAAVIREREHGTIEHLLAMPVRASEIAMGKIIANGLAIFIASGLSLWLVANLWLGVPLDGKVGVFLTGTALYLFAVAALGVWLATLAPNMPQFGLLVVPVYAVAYLLSGAATPVESMPENLQAFVRFLPTTQYVNLTQATLYRNAGLDVVWPQIAVILAAGAAFLTLALLRFRTMLARQG